MLKTAKLACSPRQQTKLYIIKHFLSELPFVVRIYMVEYSIESAQVVGGENFAPSWVDVGIPGRMSLYYYYYFLVQYLIQISLLRK
jgi:hypothetical protein